MSHQQFTEANLSIAQFSLSRWTLRQKLAGLLCLLTLTFVYIQGLKRATSPKTGNHESGYDFAIMSTAARCWIEGVSPYKEADFRAVRARQDIPIGIRPSQDPTRPDVDALSAYPPSQLPLMAPFAALSWQASKAAWWTVSFVFLLVLLASSFALFARNWSVEAKFVVAILMLQSRRLIPLVAYRGQVGICIFGLVMGGIWLLERKRGTLGGVCLGIALMKPMYVLPVLLYYGLRRSSRPMWTGFLVVVTLLTTLGLARIGGIQGIADFRAATKEYSRAGEVIDTSPANANMRSDIDNVAIVFYDIVGDNTPLVNGLTLLFGIGLIAGLWRLSKQPVTHSADRSIDLALVTLGGYLLLYHRFYDSVVLFPIAFIVLECWRVRGWKREKLFIGLVTLLFLLMFVFSIHALEIPIEHLVHRYLPGIFVNLRVWLFLLLFGLLIALRLASRPLLRPLP